MAQWRNKIEIKNLFLFDEDESNEKVLEVCNALIPQLENVLNKENRIHNKQLELGKAVTLSKDFLKEFENLIEEFKLIKNAIEKNEDSEDCHFDTWCEAFNEYLDQLYDLGDYLVTERDFWNDEKFLWIG